MRTLSRVSVTTDAVLLCRISSLNYLARESTGEASHAKAARHGTQRRRTALLLLAGRRTDVAAPGHAARARKQRPSLGEHSLALSKGPA